MEVEGEKKPRRRRWLRRLGVVVLVLVVLLAGIKVTDMAMTAYERASHPAPGQLVDVEGHKMHVHTVGGGYEYCSASGSWCPGSGFGF